MKAIYLIIKIVFFGITTIVIILPFQIPYELLRNIITGKVFNNPWNSFLIKDI